MCIDPLPQQDYDSQVSLWANEIRSGRGKPVHDYGEYAAQARCRVSTLQCFAMGNPGDADPRCML